MDYDTIAQRVYPRGATGRWSSSPEGRLLFLVDLVTTVKQAPRGLGVQYWAPEFDLWKEDGSPGPAVFTPGRLQDLMAAPGSRLPAVVRR